MHGPRIDDNNCPEAGLLPPVAFGVEVECVVARLAHLIFVGDATVPAQGLEVIAGAAADPLAKGEVGAIASGAEVGRDQETLEPIGEYVIG